MTRAFRSASTSALQVLAGVMPLGLKAQARWLNFLTKAVGGVHTIGERSFGGEFIERKENLDKIHPARRVSVPYDCRQVKVGEIDIYTDGSKIKGKVGAAFVVYYFGVKIVEKLLQLRQTTTTHLQVVSAGKRWKTAAGVHPSNEPPATSENSG